MYGLWVPIMPAPTDPRCERLRARAARTGAAYTGGDDAALSNPSIAALGVLTPPQFEPAVFETYEWVLSHPSADVRLAAVRARAGCMTPAPGRTLSADTKKIDNWW
jgi:hypothetical protein